MWPFKRKQNALAVLQNSNSELRQLLFLEKKHSADLLQQLTKALGNGCKTVERKKGTPTPKEQEVLTLLNTTDSITTASVCSALGYAARQVACALIARMIAKGLLIKTGSGKNTSYKLAD